MREKCIATEYGSVYYWLSDIWNEEKETIFFFPGLTADHTMFESQVEYFGAKYNLIVWDAPCHGKSRPYEKFDLKDSTEVIIKIMEENKIPEKFLPIGTVVLLKNGKKEVMITSYCIFPNNTEIKDGQEVKPQKKMYEYGGCIYPEGILDSNMVCAFDHHQIDKICYMGYKTEQQEELSKVLNGGYEIYKKKYENEAE